MLQRVELPGIELPRLYIAENKADADKAKGAGIPYIVWRHGMDALLRQLLRPVLEEMFPGIIWNKVLGPRRKFKTEVIIEETPGKQVIPYNDDVTTDVLDVLDDVVSDVPDVIDMPEIQDEDGTLIEESDITTELRNFSSIRGEDNWTRKLSIEEYMGDLTASVNLEVIQRLGLMPNFIGDILECVKRNLTANLRWNEGYNKKLKACVGNHNNAPELDNLIIIDVSGSIPRGISATMLSLADTLRHQLNADLIITGSNSRYYPNGCELPNPDDLRTQFGYGNEGLEFYKILNEDLSGKHYGHVFSFGDNDWPGNHYENGTIPPTIRVEAVHHYHTHAVDHPTGYALWCHDLAVTPEISFDKSWCNFMRERF